MILSARKWFWALLAAGLFMTGCGNSGKQGGQAAPAEKAKGAALTDRQQKLLGAAAPDFSLPDLDGGQVGLADLQGKVVILDFWATWCSPCRKTMPILHAVAEAFSPQQVVLYSINEGEGSDLIEPYLDGLEFETSVLLDSEMEVASRYWLEGLPYTVILDRAGMVRAIHTGYFTDMEEVLRREVEQLVGEIGVSGNSTETEGEGGQSGAG